MATKQKRKPATKPAARKKPARPVVPPIPQVKPPQRKQPDNIGPIAQMVHSAIERIQEIANACGKYEALVVVLVLVGIYCVKEATANVWPICSLIVIGVMMPLVVGFLRKWRA
jgi:hypothetical protein